MLQLQDFVYHAQIMLQINAIMIHKFDIKFLFCLSHISFIPLKWQIMSMHQQRAFLVLSSSSKISSRQLENVYQHFKFIFAIF